MKFLVKLSVTIEADDKRTLNEALADLFCDAATLDGLALGISLPSDQDEPSDAEWEITEVLH